MSVQFDVVLHEGDSGYWIASVPSLHACHSQGRTAEEALQNVQDAIRLCLEDETPRAVRLARVEV